MRIGEIIAAQCLGLAAGVAIVGLLWMVAVLLSRRGKPTGSMAVKSIVVTRPPNPRSSPATGGTP